MNAADTNVFVYALDADEAVKQAKAVDLLDRLAKQPDQAVLLWQVASEFLNQLRSWEHKGKIATTDVESAFRHVRSTFVLSLPSESVFKLSFELRKRFSLSHWDSMILAACKDIGVTSLYSEDMDAGTDYDGLTIINPFA